MTWLFLPACTITQSLCLLASAFLQSSAVGPVLLGNINLTKTPAGQTHQVLLELISNDRPGHPVFAVVDHLQFILTSSKDQQLPNDDAVMRDGMIGKAAAVAGKGGAVRPHTRHGPPDSSGRAVTEVGPLRGVESPTPDRTPSVASAAAAAATSDDFMLSRQEGVTEWKEKHPEYGVGR
jgi:hypothetical protein